MSERTFAEIFPPGDFIQEELEARGWSQIELAEILGRTPAFVNELIMAKRGITAETAKALSEAFSTSPQYWMNLQTAYQLWKTNIDGEVIARRARLYQFAPIKEMVKRHWIEPSENVEVLEQQVMKFFGISFLTDIQEPAHAARKATSYDGTTPSQHAWLCRAKQLAGAVMVRPLSKSTLDKGFGSLRSLLYSVEDIRRVPSILAEMGIRLLIIEALPQTRIDGACFWLDRKSPVIVLSVRFDRIDAFWFTLGHELGHVKNGDGLQNTFIDLDLIREGSLESSTVGPAEVRANNFATEFLVPSSELSDFISRTAPLYSAPKIIRFAKRIKVHPGIVVGQLQYRQQLSYAQHRRMLEKVRHIITQTALTDGWGQTPPVKL